MVIDMDEERAKRSDGVQHAPEEGSVTRFAGAQFLCSLNLHYRDDGRVLVEVPLYSGPDGSRGDKMRRMAQAATEAAATLFRMARNCDQDDADGPRHA